MPRIIEMDFEEVPLIGDDGFIVDQVTAEIAYWTDVDLFGWSIKSIAGLPDWHPLSPILREAIKSTRSDIIDAHVQAELAEERA